MSYQVQILRKCFFYAQGDIATCAGTWLHLWSINGEPLATVNTLIGQMGRSQHILCVCFSQHNEWDPLNVILTGSTDGVVRMWSLDYVQVPKDEVLPTATTISTNVPSDTAAAPKDDSSVIQVAGSVDDPADIAETESESSDETEFEDDDELEEGDDEDQPDIGAEGHLIKAKTAPKLQRQSSLSSIPSVDDSSIDKSEETGEKCMNFLFSFGLASSYPIYLYRTAESGPVRRPRTTSSSSGGKVRMRKRKDKDNALQRAIICKSEGLALSAALHGKSPDDSSLRDASATDENSASTAVRMAPLRSSRSDGSINDSFEMITESEVQATIQQQQQQLEVVNARQIGIPKKSRHVLKEGKEIQ